MGWSRTEWNEMEWDGVGMGWSRMEWNEMEWDGVGWDGVR